MQPTTPAVVDDLLTTSEVATMLRTSESTVRYWRYTGSGPDGLRVGKRVLYPRAAVTQWLRDAAPRDTRGSR